METSWVGGNAEEGEAVKEEAGKGKREKDKREKKKREKEKRERETDDGRLSRDLFVLLLYSAAANSLHFLRSLSEIHFLSTILFTRLLQIAHRSMECSGVHTWTSRNTFLAKRNLLI